jgi:hypothetical protein
MTRLNWNRPEPLPPPWPPRPRTFREPPISGHITGHEDRPQPGAIKEYLESKGLIVIDHRPHGSYLYVKYSKKAEKIISLTRDNGFGWRFCKTPSKNTVFRGKSYWCRK